MTSKKFWNNDKFLEDRFDMGWRNSDLRVLGSLLQHAFGHNAVYTHDEVVQSNRHWKRDFTIAQFEEEIVKLGGRKVMQCTESDGDTMSGYMWPLGFLRMKHRLGHVGEPVTMIFADAATRDKVIDQLRTFTVAIRRPPPATRGTNIYMLSGSPINGYGLQNLGFENSTLKEDNYDPHVLSGIKYVTEQLLVDNPDGRLALLEGPPGGGKTRAVRAMIANMNNKARVIIIPSHMVAEISGPNLVSVLIGHRGTPTILILEDADAALLSREAASQKDKELNTGALASVLNLSDGIIGSMVDIRLLCTTNAKVQEVDPAILRPGRLIARVHIDKLSTSKGIEVVLREAKATQEQLTTFLASDAENVSKMSSWVHGQMTLAEAYEVGLKLRQWLAAQQAVVDAISNAIPANGSGLGDLVTPKTTEQSISDAPRNINIDEVMIDGVQVVVGAANGGA